MDLVPNTSELTLAEEDHCSLQVIETHIYNRKKRPEQLPASNSVKDYS
jgi:hypothetical protein